MVTEGKSLKMRHVAGTHRVDLDWEVERVILDSNISYQGFFHHFTVERLDATFFKSLPH